MKNLLMFISSLMMMLPLEAQNESNPFTGAWQYATIDTAGVTTYEDIIKVFTPSGLLKGVGNMSTKNAACLWLEGTYDYMGDSIQGSYTEHCKWHHNSQYVGYDTEFFYKIAGDVLTITYKNHPETSETWIRVGSQTNNVIESDEPNKTTRFSKTEKAYTRDKNANANTPFQLAGIWKKGKLALELRNIHDFLKSKKDFKKLQHTAVVDIEHSQGDYVLMCEDGFVVDSNAPWFPLPPRLLSSSPDTLFIDEEKVSDSLPQTETVVSGGPRFRFLCEQYSVLSPTELGLDWCIGRVAFYPLCDDIFQCLRTNKPGYMMSGEYYWRPNTNQKYKTIISKITLEDEDDDDLIIEISEESAMFPGGDQACFEWMAKHAKYPAIAIEEKISGYVLADFYVEKDGSIGPVDIIRSPDPSLSKEVERVLRGMPQWSPAKVNGVPCRTRFQVPFFFELIDPMGNMIEPKNYDFSKNLKDLKSIHVRATLSDIHPSDTIRYERY